MYLVMIAKQTQFVLADCSWVRILPYASSYVTLIGTELNLNGQPDKNVKCCYGKYWIA